MRKLLFFAVVVLVAASSSASTVQWLDDLVRRFNGDPSAMAAHGLALCKGDGALKDEIEGLAWLEAARQIKDVLHPSSGSSLNSTDYEPDTLALQCAEVSKGMSEEFLAGVRKQTQEILSDTYDNGCSFSRPEATAYSSLLLLASPKQDDKILGLALLYAGSIWFARVSPSEGRKVDAEYDVDYSALIARTEDELGKNDSIKAQELAGKIYGNLSDDGIARSVAVLKALNPALGKSEEDRRRKSSDEYFEGIENNFDKLTNGIRIEFEKTWVEKVSDFFGGGE